MAGTGRPRIRVEAELRGLPGTEHLHVVVRQVAGRPAEEVELVLDGTGGPWTHAPEPRRFQLGLGQRRWASFGVEPDLAPKQRFVFDVVVRGASVRLRRRFRLEEHRGHWRLRPGNRVLHRRPEAETSNVPTG